MVRGRKVPKGTKGIVKSIATTPYGLSVSLDWKVWVDARNLHINYKGEFVEPQVYVEKTFYFQAV